MKMILHALLSIVVSALAPISAHAASVEVGAGIAQARTLDLPKGD